MLVYTPWGGRHVFWIDLSHAGRFKRCPVAACLVRFSGCEAAMFSPKTYEFHACKGKGQDSVTPRVQEPFANENTRAGAPEIRAVW